MRKLLLSTALVALPIVAQAQAVDPTLDPLHICYAAPGNCTGFNGVQISNNPMTGLSGWGISSSPAPQTGLLSIAILVPQNDTETVIPTLSGLFSGVPVTEKGTAIPKGFFGPNDFIGSIFGGTNPPEPVSSFQAATIALDPGFTAAMGYNVWLINIQGNNPAITGQQAAGSVTTGGDPGLTNVLDNTFAFAGGDFQVNGTGPLIAGLPNGTIITAFMDETACTSCNGQQGGIVSTAQSSSVVLDAQDAPPVPEPSTIALLGVGLLGLGTVVSRKRR